MDYKKLDVWVQSRSFVKQVYLLTSDFPSEEKFGLVAQMRKCAISISSNIAEGCGRQTPKDTINFLHIARGSAYELETQLILAEDLEFLKVDIKPLLKELDRVKMLINGFINYHKNMN